MRYLARQARARKILDELTETQNRNYVSAYGMAVIYTGFGDKDRAFDWLHEAYEERSN